VALFCRYHAYLSGRRLGGFLLGGTNPRRGFTVGKEQGRARGHGRYTEKYVLSKALLLFTHEGGSKSLFAFRQQIKIWGGVETKYLRNEGFF